MCYHCIANVIVSSQKVTTTVRTQIQLTEEQAQALKRLAADRHVSMAEIMRRSMDRIHSYAGTSEDERWQRAGAVAGRFRSGKTDIAANHDRHLAEAYGE
mgnify:CR=1 FL=1